MNKAVLFCVTCLALLCIVTSCRKPEPVKLGFVGGLSGRGADLGIAGRNGALLAVEQANAAGGINNRPIELIMKDDHQDPATAQAAITELINQKIECIIGPMTSSMAAAMLPVINQSDSILLSPTVTTTSLTGKDDNFIRVIADTKAYAEKSARFQYAENGRRRVAAIYDSNNLSYSESWFTDFRNEFVRLGGKLVQTETFRSSDNTIFTAKVKALFSSKPDLVLVIANSLDAAMICQQIRKINRAVPIVMSDWASTERFIELAGAASEGVYVTQLLDRNDRSENYLKFRKAYMDRFGHEPGFAGLAAYDAARIALEATSGRKGNESIKQAILGKKQFRCVQQMLDIDAFGDANRKTYLSRVINGLYSTQE